MSEFDLRPSERAQRAFSLRRKPAGERRAEPGASAASMGDLEWSFDESAPGDRHAGEPRAQARTGTHAARRPAPSADAALTDPYRGAEGARRAEAVRRALSDALVLWWRDQRLPDDGLLREGLLVLEAGHPLDESQRTLLARTALARGRGVVTALKHQTDPERVAGLLREAILDGRIDAAALDRLRTDDSLLPGWQPFLLTDLRADRFTPNAEAAARAGQAVAVLEHAHAPPLAEGAYALEEDAAGPAAPGRGRLAAVLLMVALAAAALWALRLRQADPQGMVAVPAGSYAVSAGADEVYSAGPMERRVELAAFWIDRTEVTNAAYRECYAAGVCPRPVERGSATRAEYFLDAAYDTWPVIEVDWASANRYCEWRGKRLPTAAEWEVAATWAPATGRAYRYPWGEGWEPALAIGGGGFEDTAAVGSRSPQGDSPLGAADMAGNVAEWTADVPSGHPDLAMVRGGSWRDRPYTLLPTSILLIRKIDASNAVGFRCVQGR